MNKLRGSRCYLSGAMEVCADSGVEWRKTFIPFLNGLGVTVLDPTDKPTDVIIEDPEKWKWLRETEQYDQLRKEMKVLRCVDLRMVDVSDFLIVNFDLEVRTCGTWEEISLANRQKKPVIFRIKQGKKQWPLWFFGQLPHEMVFGTWNHVKEYLLTVNRGEALHRRRWLLFDFCKKSVNKGMIQLGRPTDAPDYLAVIVNDTGECIPVQNDSDWLKVAFTFGWVPRFDDNENMHLQQLINEAGEWIQENYGKVVEDPGYFNSEE